VLYLGLDGGATKTAAAVVDEAGRTIGAAIGGASSYKSLGLAAAARELASVAARAVTEASAGQQAQIGVLVAGVSDVDTAQDRGAVHEHLSVALAEAGVRVGRLEVVNDAVIALASGVSALSPGVACIAGTGSVAFGVDGRGGEARAGGWGPPFGDAGGAYWIGFQAVSRALREHDRGRRATPLIERLLTASGCASLDRLVYEHLGAAGEIGMARDRLPALARAAEQAAVAGDPVAMAVFEEAAVELAALVIAVAGRLGISEQAFDVVQVGGVWNAAVPVLHERFAAELAAVAPDARRMRPSVDPAVGAARLALDLADGSTRCPSGLLEL
jgi:N-acetylglucosamine kinase-like BadF-type ATPase